MLTGPLSVPVGTGPIRNGSFTTFALTDRVSLEVNTGSGNLLIRSADLMLPGIAENLVVGAAYNSLFTGSDLAVGSLGHGWRTRTGVDVKLVKHTGWKLTEHESGRELYFTSAGLLDRTLDRNDNVTDYSYDGSARLTSVKSDRGATAARTATVHYGSHGFISKIEQSSEGDYRRVEYAYDGNGNLTEICSLNQNDVRFEYDSQHRITKITSAISTTDVGAVTRIGYDSGHRVVSVSRVIDETVDPNASAVTRWAYPSATQTLIADANTNYSQPVTSVPRSTFTINADKRVTNAVDPEGKRRSKSYTPYFDVATATNGTGGLTTNAYGANGGQSLTTSTGPTGFDTSYTYANAATPSNPTANYQPSSFSDSQGNTSTYTYNGAGNRLSATDALAAEAKVEYNSDGTVKSSTDPGNGTNKTLYAYNGDKQLTTITPPTGTTLGVRTFTYDQFGRLHEAYDGAGRMSHYDYDYEDRATKITYSDGTPAVEYRYTPGGNIVRRIDATGTASFSFDRLNRMVVRQGSQTYTYDPVGNLKTLTDQRGTSTYSYNTRNLLTSLVAANGTYTLGYDDEGRRTSTTLKVAGATVAQTSNTFDLSGRLIRTTSKRWQGGTESIVYDSSSCYAKRVGSNPCSTAKPDDTGLRQWQTDHHRAGAVSVYTYDNGNRLTKATNVEGQTYDYEYDANGNRKTAKVNGTTTQSLTFNAANQITSSGYAYDAVGNQTAGSTVRTPVYNAAGQLTSAKDTAANTVSFKYAGPNQNELGYRSTQTFQGRYFYGLNDANGLPMLQYYTVPSSYAKHYVERDQQGTALGFRAETNGTVHHYFYVFDALGSVVALVKHDGTVAGTYRYDPYGKATATGTSDEVRENAIGFAGGLRSDDQVKFGRRWYDPNTGRFTQQDNLSFVGNPAEGNCYAYAACNPATYVDPTGQCSTSSILGAVSAIVSGGSAAIGTWMLAGVVTVPFTAGAVLIVGGALGALLGVGSLIYCALGD
ncbi:RHS repeat-associated core domain-containing protein [Asanoa hainanensis]|uniref:RHS repeat-associated core domain-containing protein n=1 Tax=Asanoa hainanensis TaxID=560556 RepID=A0A239N5A2_9ACTN|nr:RHS repeat-associated core domain-containing protein [Asanoa hainanensis]SNT49359.1 RHS repeat-associated core domain-containing protein [Asanoa hainanensis]